MIQEKLIAMISEHLGCDPSEITGETTFDSLGVDSLDMVEIVMQIEDELGITIELDQKIETVAELAAFIESKKG